MKIKFEDLPKEEQNILAHLYGSQSGYFSKKISYIEEIEEDKRYFFEKNNFISPNFFVQRLYKVVGNIVPLKFNLALSKLIEKTDEFRTNYCTAGHRTLKIIFENRKEMPSVVYRNLENTPDIDSTLKNILAADMRQVFDIRHGNLVRFAVFHTGPEEYAVLITMPHIILDSFDVQQFFLGVMDLNVMPTTEKPKIKMPPKKSEPIKNYWTGILKDLPQMPAIPMAKNISNVQKQQAYRVPIPSAVMSDLRAKSQSNKLMLMAIFQSAWAALLQEFNNSLDVVFSTLLPDKTTEDVNAVPVRIKSSKTEKLSSLVNQNFKQVLISQPYACNNFSIMQEILMPQNKNFDYFLSFNDFLKDEKLFSEVEGLPGGQFVLQNSWSSENAKFGIYFHDNDGSVSISILYDANKFSNNFGENILKRYLIVLQEMIIDWDLDYGKFLERLSQRLTAEFSKKESEDIHITDFISRLDILHSSDKGIWQFIKESAVFKTYFEGDRIDEKDIESSLIFVAYGKIVRSIDTGDGWYTTLDILKEKRVVNENIFLNDRKTKISAEVLTDKAVLMSIKFDDMEKVFKSAPSVRYSFLMYVLKELEKYQRLWIQS